MHAHTYTKSNKDENVCTSSRSSEEQQNDTNIEIPKIVTKSSLHLSKEELEHLAKNAEDLRLV